MSFSILEATLSGFRLIQKKPGVLVVWAAFGFLMFLGFVAVILLTVGGALMGALQQAGAVSQSPGVLLSAAGGVVGMLAVGLPVAMLVSAMYQAAAYRVVLEPARDRWGYLRIGLDEVRVAISTLALVLLIGVAVFIPAALFGVLGAALRGWPQAEFVFQGAGFLATLAWLGFLIVRFSLAPVMTYAEKRIVVFESWGLTGPVFWRVAATYLLIFLLTLVVWLTLGFVGNALLFLGVGPELRTIIEGRAPDLSHLGVGPVLAALISVVMQLAIRVMMVAITNVPAASIYRQLKPLDAEVF